MEPEDSLPWSQSPPLVPILSQMNPVQTLPHYFPKIRSNIIFPTTPISSKWSFPFRSSNQNILCISHLFCAWYMSYSSHLPWLGHPSNTWWSVQVKKLL